MKYFETRIIVKDWESGMIRIFSGPRIPANNVKNAVKRCKNEHPYLIVVGDDTLDVPSENIDLACLNHLTYKN